MQTEMADVSTVSIFQFRGTASQVERMEAAPTYVTLLFFYPGCVTQSEAGCAYRPWPRSGDDAVVASES